MKLPGEEPTTIGQEFIELSSDVTFAILTILAAGWRHAVEHGDIDAQAGEVLITERLRDGMREALKRDGYAWARMLWVFPGTESRSKNVMLPDGRTDIPLGWLEIFIRRGEHDPHAIVECKRIAGSQTDLCREYVVEGIDRFCTGKYAFNHVIGFMVGYLISGTDNEAAAGVNAYLARRSRNSEELRRPGAIPSTWVSRHARGLPSPAISLHHAFFELAPARQ